MQHKRAMAVGIKLQYGIDTCVTGGMDFSVKELKLLITGNSFLICPVEEIQV